MSTGLQAVCDECRKRIFVGGRSGGSFYFARSSTDIAGQKAAAMWVYDHAMHGRGVRIIREETDAEAEEYEYVRLAEEDDDE